MTSRGLSSATPRKIAAAPSPTQVMPGLSTSKTPASISARPTDAEDDRGDVAAAPLLRGREHGALAQPGDRRHARRAQRGHQRGEHGQPGAEHAAPTMIVRASITVPRVGQVDAERREQRARSPGRRRSRRARRRPRRPARSTKASITTEERIWRRLAPSVRSIANSRVRWATVIENVLKIRNAATNSATPAKISSAVFRKPMNSPTSSRWDCDVLGPGLDLERRSAAPRSGWRRAAPGVVPGSAATLIWSSLPSLPVIRCASGRVSSAIVAPPNESTSPSVAIPTSV